MRIYFKALNAKIIISVKYFFRSVVCECIFVALKVLSNRDVRQNVNDNNDNGKKSKHCMTNNRSLPPVCPRILITPLGKRRTIVGGVRLLHFKLRRSKRIERSAERRQTSRPTVVRSLRIKNKKKIWKKKVEKRKKKEL